MSQEDGNFLVPVALNWKWQDSGSATTTTGELEDREVGQRRDQAAARMIGLRPILSDSAPKKMKKGVPRASSDGDQDVGGVAVDLQGLGQEEQGVELAGVPDHGLAHHRRAGPAGRSWRSSRSAEGFLSGAFEGALFLHLGEGRRFVHLTCGSRPRRQQQDRDQEGNAPAPGREVGGVHALRTPRITSSDRNRPSVAVVWIQEV
jgi:hypothetical protein